MAVDCASAATTPSLEALTEAADIHHALDDKCPRRSAPTSAAAAPPLRQARHGPSATPPHAGTAGTANGKNGDATFHLPVSLRISDLFSLRDAGPSGPSGRRAGPQAAGSSRNGRAQRPSGPGWQAWGGLEGLEGLEGRVQTAASRGLTAQHYENKTILRCVADNQAKPVAGCSSMAIKDKLENVVKNVLEP